MSGLSVVLVLLAIAAWASTGILVVKAIQRPWIGVLIERALIAFVLAVFGTVCVILVLNTDTGAAVIPIETARLIFRVCLVVLLLVPTYWLVLYFTDRMGGQ